MADTNPRDIKRNADNVVGPRVDQLMRGLMLEALKRLMQRTPVNTGRARANWNVSQNTPDTSVNEDAGTSANQGGVDPAKFAEGQTEIMTVDFFDGDVGFIVNSLPYIEPLEQGSSTQAPEGMVAVTVEELKPQAAKIGAEVSRG